MIELVLVLALVLVFVLEELVLGGWQELSRNFYEDFAVAGVLVSSVPLELASV